MDILQTPYFYDILLPSITTESRKELWIQILSELEYDIRRMLRYMEEEKLFHPLQHSTLKKSLSLISFRIIDLERITFTA